MLTSTPTSRLGEEHEAISELLLLLKQEQLHLIGADIEQLTGLTAQKSVLVQRMALLAGARHKALAAAGFGVQLGAQAGGQLGAPEAGMTAWIAAAADASAAALWRQVLDLTREAKEYNRLNGMLINKHMVHTRDALNVLRPPALGGNIYGPSGLAASSPARGRFVLG